MHSQILPAMNQRNKMASMLTKKAKTQDESAALTNLRSQSRSTIVAANHICNAMNATKNEAPAIAKQDSANRSGIVPLLTLSFVAGHTIAQRFLVRNRDAVKDSSPRPVLPDLHSMAEAAEIANKTQCGALRHHASRDMVA
jgi:hypothetical protein